MTKSSKPSNPLIIALLLIIISLLGYIIIERHYDDTPFEKKSENTTPIKTISTKKSKSENKVKTPFNKKSNLAIIGNWSASKAEKIALDLVKKDGLEPDCLFGDCIMEYQLIQHSEITLKNKNSVITIFASKSSGEQCHSCDAPISIFEFEQVEGGYKLAAQYINISTLGTYGNAPDNINVIQIAQNQYAIEIENVMDWSGGDAINTNIYELYLPQKKSLEKIFYFEEKDYWIDPINPDYKSSKWSSKIIFIENGKGLYNMSIKTVGKKKNIPLNEEYFLQFDGNKYVTI